MKAILELVFMLTIRINADSTPPLLAIPLAPAPLAEGPRGPSGEYDSGYFYLPTRAPESSPKPRRFGRMQFLPPAPIFPDRPRLLFK